MLYNTQVPTDLVRRDTPNGFTVPVFTLPLTSFVWVWRILNRLWLWLVASYSNDGRLWHILTCLALLGTTVWTLIFAGLNLRRLQICTFFVFLFLRTLPSKYYLAYIRHISVIKIGAWRELREEILAQQWHRSTLSAWHTCPWLHSSFLFMVFLDTRYWYELT